MSKILFFILSLFLSAFIIFGESAHAQPTVSISTDAASDGRSVIITFVQDDLDSMVGCYYSLLAASKRSHLDELPGEGISIATFIKFESPIPIIASPLRLLKRASVGRLHRAHVTFYLRTLILCSDTPNGIGEIVSFKMPTSNSGKLTKLKQLVLEMKNHMAYYNP